MNIFVSNISFKATEAQVQELFQEYGIVNSVKIITDKETRKSRGFGFVEMPNTDEANAAISQLHDLDFQGRNLIVNEAKPQPARSQDNRKPQQSRY